MLVIRPNITHLNKIHDWLKEEYLNEQTGFYSNWRKIKEAFEEEELLIFEAKQVAVGFIVFTEIDSICIIDIAVIMSAERNRGIGSEFINQAIHHFKTRGTKVLKVFCSPPTSESFWRKHGFDNSNDPLIELGTSLILKINANLNVNPSLTPVSSP